MYAKAQNHVKKYLDIWPKDEMMVHLYQPLISGTKLHELKSLFTKGDWFTHFHQTIGGKGV